jgi:hypothetical protein
MRSSSRLLSLLCVLFLAVQLDVYASVNVFDKPVLHPAIPLVDEDGQHVLTTGKPYSTRMSCGNGEGGGCHDIDKISKAYHFEMGREETGDSFGKDRGLAALTGPGFFGGYNCGYNPFQTNNPQWLAKKSNSHEFEFLDYGAPGLIKSCAQCHNGGGFAEKDRDDNRYDKTADTDIKALDGDYFDWQTAAGSNTTGSVLTKWNWQKSGVIEPDCLICHADFSKFKQPVQSWVDLRAKQFIEKGFFRYANSAIFAYLNIAPDSVDGKNVLKTDGSLGADGLPVLQWNADAFDSNGKLTMPMLRFPADDNCMQCHVTSNSRRGFYGFGDVAKSELNADGTLKPDAKDDIHKGKSWSDRTGYCTATNTNPSCRSIENCNSCHSKQYYKDLYLNVDLDADHNFLMGNSDEDVRRDLNFQPGPLSCERCHNGTAYGGAANPALPSGHSNILDAHRELWKARGDMVGYPANTLNKVTLVHLDEIACQTCHIPNLQNEGADLKIRYRYRKGEDGILKMMPYIPSSRYYWIDQTSQRVLTRAERLSVSNGVDSDPQTYTEIKNLKAAYDKLLSDKGYAKANTQMVWTESNEYLVSHNTRAAVSAMPCEGCHTRKSNGSVSSLVEPNLNLGKQNIRVVSSIADNTAYARLVKEGVVKLDMPYFSVSSAGKIVENVDDILYETKLNPFTSVVKSNSQDIANGQFRVATKGDALTAANFGQDAAGFSALSNKLAPSVYLFNNANVGSNIKQLSVLINYNNSSKLIVPNYRIEAAANTWFAYTLSPAPKKPKKKTTLVTQGTVTSPVYRFQIQDQQKQATDALAGNKFYIKLPYAGRATDYRKVDLFETQILSGTLLAPLKVLAAEILAVKPGNTVNPGYVVAVLDRLPERVLLIDLKKAKKKK